MKKLIFALMSVLFLAIFTACSSDDNNGGGNDNGGGDENFDEFLYKLINQDGNGKWVTDTSNGMKFNIDNKTLVFNMGIVPNTVKQELTFKVVSNNEIEVLSIEVQGQRDGFTNYFEVGDIVRITFPPIGSDGKTLMSLHNPNPNADGEYTGYNHHELYWKANSN